MSSKIIYGKTLVCDANTIVPSGAVYIEGDKIQDIGSHRDITQRYKADVTLGSAETLIIPGFVNSHGHGMGITDFQRGQIDDTLESWKWHYYPPLDPYYDTLWMGILMIEAGVTTNNHQHILVDRANYREEFDRVLTAYSLLGIRTNISPLFGSENVFVYGDNEKFIASLSADLQRLCRRILDDRAKFGEKEYFETVDWLYREHSSPKVRVIHSPISPQWVRDEVLQEVRRQATERNMKIHIHVQQSQLQRLYGLKRYGKTLLSHLHDLGFLAPDVTCGHAVWLSDDDIDLLLATGTSTTHHPGCNLRVRNGVSPAFELLRKGVRVGLGMDEKEFGDNKDFVAEMRLAAKLHRLPSHRLDSDHLVSRDVFRMGTEHGAYITGFADEAGTLAKGKQADIVLVDLEHISEPYIYPGHSPLDLLLYRGSARDVRTVLVAGEVLLQGGQLTRIDRSEVIRKYRESIPKDYRKQFDANNALFPELRAVIARYFDPWYEEIGSWPVEPYYHMNNRR